VRSSRARIGAFLAGLAAVGLGLDTRQPWYELQAGAGLPSAHETGSIPFSAHDLLRTIDGLLVAIAVLVLVLVVVGLLRSAQSRPNGDGRVLVVFGAIAFLLVGYRILIPPLPALHLRAGTWIALVAASLIVAGGLLRTGD